MNSTQIISLARKNVVKLVPYSSARNEFEGTASVFLDANENPYPEKFNRYPDPHQRVLKAEISKLKNVSADRIFLGNGSDEVIDLLFRVFCEPGLDEVIIPQPTYGMYKVSADINSTTVSSPDLTSAFDLDAPSILKIVTPRTKMIFLCSPNNPSGNLLSESQVLQILMEFNGLVVIDEAYIDFSESESWSNRLSEFPNLVILQTFSKAWGMAGLRLGMCFAHIEIIKLLNKIKPPYNVNTFTQSEVLKSIRTNLSLKDKWVAEIVQERGVLSQQLATLRVVKKVHPSDANFLLVSVTDPAFIYQALIRKGIVVRDRSKVKQCEDCLRITVGKPGENQLLINTLREL